MNSINGSVLLLLLLLAWKDLVRFGVGYVNQRQLGQEVFALLKGQLGTCILTLASEVGIKILVPIRKPSNVGFERPLPYTAKLPDSLPEELEAKKRYAA